MELANVMQDYLAGGGARGAEWDEAVSVLVRLLNPMAPHIAEELWERVGDGTWKILRDCSNSDRPGM